MIISTQMIDWFLKWSELVSVSSVFIPYKIVLGCNFYFAQEILFQVICKHPNRVWKI